MQLRLHAAEGEPERQQRGGTRSHRLEQRHANAPIQHQGRALRMRADRVDAWNRVEDVKIGSAWVVEIDGELHAFSSVCPHLGCAVEWSAEMSKFKCPCHRSAFAVDGTAEEGPAPRPLDALAIESREGGLIAIRYERFKQGVEEQVKV